MAGKQVVLITGCNGRVGKNLIQYLKTQYHIIGIDNEDKPTVKGIEYYRVDISKSTSIQSCIKEIAKNHPQLNCVIHLIAYYSFEVKESPLYEKITEKGTLYLLQALNSIEIKQFIFTSTLLVHKPCKIGEKITEKSPVQARWGYPESKINTEKIVKHHCKGFPLVILRVAGCYDDLCHSIPISHHIERIYHKSFKRFFYPGNKHKGNSYLHFDDLTEAIALCIEKKENLPSCETFILSEEETFPYEQMQNLISIKLFNKKCPIIKIPKWLAKLGSYFQIKMPFIKKPFIQPWMIDLTDDHYEVDISHAKQQLGWVPKHRLDKTMKKILNKLQANPKKWLKENHLE